MFISDVGLHNYLIVAALLDKRHSSEGSGTTFLQVSGMPLWFLDSMATGMYEIPRADAISLGISEGYQSTISRLIVD